MRDSGSAEAPPSQGRFLLNTACAVVIVAGLKAAQAILTPFLLAVFLSILGMPLLSWLQGKRIPKAVAVLITILALLALLALAGFLVSGSVNDFRRNLPAYQERFEQLIAGTQGWLGERGVSARLLDFESFAQPQAVMDFVGTTLQSAAAILSNFLLVLLTVVFILLEAAGFPAKLQATFGASEGRQRFARIRHQVQHYLAIKTLVSLATGVLIWAWLALWGVDYAVLWGLVAFLFNYIPNLGSILAAVPAVLMALILQGPGRALIVAVGYVAVNLLLGNLIEPHLMGRRLGLSTLVVFLSLVFWGWVWGPIGMLLSVPLTMILKITLENTREFRHIALLLGPNPPTDTPSPPG